MLVIEIWVPAKETYDIKMILYHTADSFLTISSSALCSARHSALSLLHTAPSDVSNLTVIVTTSRSMSVSWKPPGRANGVVSQYRIRVIDVTRNQPAPLLVFNSTTHSAVVAGLLPYTVYQLHLETVTAGGSGVGPVVNATTLEDGEFDYSKYQFV